ncbi:MAG: hypothetical protein ACREIA_21090 [Opitutaceae bacterium]
MAGKDGLLAAGLAMSEIPAGPERDAAVVTVVQSWARKEPRAAAGWIQRFPAGETRAQAVRRLIGEWAAADLEDCSRWVAGLENGPFFELAARMFTLERAIDDSIVFARDR